MANPTNVRKSFTHGEIGLAIALTILALFSLIVAGNVRSETLAARLGARRAGEYLHPTIGAMNVWRHPGPGTEAGAAGR